MSRRGAHAKRSVGTVRLECLDRIRILILGRCHLHHVLVTYFRQYEQTSIARAGHSSSGRR